MVYIDERLDVIGNDEYVQVNHDECEEDWLEVIDDVDGIQMGAVGCVDEMLDKVEDLDVGHVEVVDEDEADAVAAKSEVVG